METGLELPTERTPCPACGSISRHIERSVDDRVDMHSSLRLKHRRGATGKIAQEQQVGDDFHRDTASWRDLTRVRDYENDRYFEHIEDASGQVIRHVEEPLSEHTGRGSDKPARRTERAAKASENAARRAARKAEIDAAWRARAAQAESDDDAKHG